MKSCFILLTFLVSIPGYSQIKPFRFAFISDTHIGSSNGSAEEDLRRTVRDINAMTDLTFAVPFYADMATEYEHVPSMLIEKDH